MQSRRSLHLFLVGRLMEKPDANPPTANGRYRLSLNGFNASTRIRRFNKMVEMRKQQILERILMDR